VDILLNDIDARVLGSLIEKEITTPDYYPLSLNALINACNQKNNREPVMNLDEPAVRDALRSLGEQRLAGPASGADSRVTKYEHRVYDSMKLDRREIAVLCVLLLRGPQTPGELRGRTERMYQFPELSDVQATLQKMMQREPALVTMLARQPGTKEARYAHLLSGEVQAWEPAQTVVATTGADNDKIAKLENEVAALREEVENLKSQFAEFRKQFE
jgi:uncharacterized protein YceH (UPF0502 family)